MARRQRRRDRAKEQHWRRVVRDWRRSRLSIREFCDWQELSEGSFYAWRRELTKRDKEAAGVAMQAESKRRPAKKNGAASVSPPMFLPVRVVAEPPTRDTSAKPRIEVRLPSGVRLRVPAGYDRQSLADLLTALETRPC